MRRRKLGPVEDSHLLRPLGRGTGQSSEKTPEPAPSESEEAESSGGLRVQLRARKPKVDSYASRSGGDGAARGEEDETIVEEISIVDDSVYFSFSSSEEEYDDDDHELDWSLEDVFRKKSRARGATKSKAIPRGVPHSLGDAPKILPRQTTKAKRQDLTSESLESVSRLNDTSTAADSCRDSVRVACKETQPGELPKGGKNGAKSGRSPKDCPNSTPSSDDLADPFSKLKLEPTLPSETQGGQQGRDSTPPPKTPPKSRPKGLVSPSKKIPRIPTTPHHPNTDAFWSQQVTDNWIDQHSPRKLFAPESRGLDSPVKASPTKKELAAVAASQRAAKKIFQAGKHEMAEKFLRELDESITGGKLGEMANPTGGIRIQWTNKLNTTAGRANWRRETIKTVGQVASQGSSNKDLTSGAKTTTETTTVTVTHRHHACIELAEKVIDSEDRLLNVIAHEFCHLANFMISGVTTQPHGKEFKSWAALCSRRFGSRGIMVTTKHTYDIDFKYVWECIGCPTVYKRHSKSVNPERHRCGACKGQLRQTKPVPRKAAGAGNPTASVASGAGVEGISGAEKRPPSEYQQFVREQIKAIKEENPGGPQKDLMKQVAERWAKKTVVKKIQSSKSSRISGESSSVKPQKGGDDVADVADGLVGLSLVDKPS